MNKDNTIKLNAIRKKIDSIDDKILKLVSKRFKEIHKVAALKDNSDQIVDNKRIKKILTKIKSKAKKEKLDNDFAVRLWQLFIQEAIRMEYSKIKN
ncbi:MAG: chorismate mutase [Pelagibacteraceae bacterium]|nr:chorismate mutase [Pelagibacteraceae bacterium]|tara:strand:+ start:246 stop:533 length:288 start_codon:yes stop_codon:yes gene_type:complete